MNILRRFTALLLVAALATPLTGDVPRGCERKKVHEGMVMVSHPQAADTGGPERGHCGECDSQESRSPSSCDSDDATQCATVSCAFASAIILESANRAVPVALSFANVEVDAHPARVAAAPEPPPPRA